MQTNVESAFAATADCFEDILRNDLNLRDTLATQIHEGRKPHLVRVLDNTLAGGKLTLVLDKHPA